MCTSSLIEDANLVKINPNTMYLMYHADFNKFLHMTNIHIYAKFHNKLGKNRDSFIKKSDFFIIIRFFKIQI